MFIICHAIEHPFPDSKWFFAMGVRRFPNAPFSHFKAMSNASINSSLFDCTVFKECSSSVSQSFT